MRSTFINHTLLDGDHADGGEPLTPLLTGVAPAFIHLGVPDEFYVLGGCPDMRGFDLIAPAGTAAGTFRSGGGLLAARDR